MKTRANMGIAGKTVCVFVLFTITKGVRTVEYKRVSATVGNSSVLTCSPKSDMTMVTWRISPEAGSLCILGYRTDENKTDRINCSDSVDWKFRPDQDLALEIRQVGIADEGNYTCDVASPDGNFPKTYHLTVLVPPRLILSCDDHGNPVCKAATGKPAAQISWVLESNSTPKEEGHANGTVTVLSKFTAYSTSMINTTCIVFHPTGNQSKSVVCQLPKNSFILHVSIIFCILIIITFLAVIYYIKLHSDRLCHITKPPETSVTHFPQDDTMEVEPYTTYVQKENIIYNSVSDLTVGQNLPQGLFQQYE
ncbi:cell surface glycoprotein CD200 receptor 1-A isoform X2 [Cuculus canorus]|uniref:cell surface glycoprotein CD200 receptor 1-A isoform X2 n=1 Tax=Cuculus canorus TaxID=55661 RepID=UPI0023AA6EAA|nr:cell surface glycoprotein CD200 receptor 1-A isoform X2 [Cuculus canorus]